LTAASTVLVPFFGLMLAADIFGRWYHGRGGPYGFTIWLALISWILLTELNVVHRVCLRK